MSSPDAQIPSANVPALEPGEHLLWWDRPKGGLLLRRADAWLIPLSLAWGSICLSTFFLTVWWTTNPTLTAVFMTSLFAAAAVYIILGRFLHDMWRRSRLIYGLTERRALIVSPSRTESVDLESLDEMAVTAARGGYGSIAFGRHAGPFSRADLGAWMGWPAVPTFEFIREHDRVAALIRDLRQKLTEAV